MLRTACVRLIFVCAATAAATASGDDLFDSTPSPHVEQRFVAGRFEASLTSGIVFSPYIATQNRPTINYTLTGLQLGRMLNDVQEWGVLRGNCELAVEGFGGSVVQGHGGFVSGMTLWLRYNFVPERWRIAPYAQAGAGTTFTDIDRDMVGDIFNFNLNLGTGFRYLAGRSWAVSLEYRFQHISNANLGPRNIGINAHGPVLGISRFF